MCELFAMSAEGEKRIDEELKEFFSHSTYHPNGWGLMTEQKGLYNWEKEPVCANESRYLKERLSEPVIASTALAHIRYATIGNVSWHNTHPFSAMDKSERLWTLIHNGTIFDYAPSKHLIRIQKGETDSERILLYIIEEVNKAIDDAGRDLNDEERFSIVERIITSMSSGNKLNIAIFDGSLMYCHTNCAGTLYRKTCDGMTAISTRPLSFGKWESVPQLKVIAYSKGRLLYEGELISKEYIENPKEIAQLYLAYSGL